MQQAGWFTVQWAWAVVCWCWAFVAEIWLGQAWCNDVSELWARASGDVINRAEQGRLGPTRLPINHLLTLIGTFVHPASSIGLNAGFRRRVYCS